MRGRKYIGNEKEVHRKERKRVRKKGFRGRIRENKGGERKMKKEKERWEK